MNKDYLFSKEVDNGILGLVGFAVLIVGLWAMIMIPAWILSLFV